MRMGVSTPLIREGTAMKISPRDGLKAKLVIASLLVLVSLVVPVADQPDAQAQGAVGAAIYIAGDFTGVVDVFDQAGAKLESFDGGFTLADGFAAGDVNGDGADEVLIAGDFTHIVDIFDSAGIRLGSFDGGFTLADGFAAGDVNGDGSDEILIAGDVTGVVDIFNQSGAKINSFDAGFTIFDGFAAGDVNGDGSDEILTAGDFTGQVDIFNGSGTKLNSFDGDFTLADGFAAGDINGDDADEILIAGDVSGVVDIFNGSGTKVNSFDGDFTLADGFAAGDVNDDGVDEILIAGDVTGVVDIFNGSGTKLGSFDGDFTLADGFAIGRHGYPDQDGDALLDPWETQGLDRDGNGTIDVDLPAMGADPMRKDLFLEMDCIVAVDHSHCPAQNAVQRMVQSFADAPVSNPDGTMGIQLHVDTGALYGAGNVVAVAGTGGVTGNFGDFGGGSQIPEAGNSIVDWDGNSGDPATNFYDLKSSDFNSVRDFVFRYAIFVHQTNARAASNDCTSGWAEGIPANDFIVSLGGTDGSGSACWGTDTNGFSVGSENQQAGTFQHEFGHTLGLHHGGGDDLHNKPNYLSVMNYSFQMCDVTSVPASGLPGGCDYSRFDLPDLNEELPPGLDECQGLDGVLNLGPVDWDGDGITEGVTNCQPPNSANVQADVNGDASLDTLTGFEDWNSIRYNFRMVPEFANGVASPVPDEADPQVIEQSRAWLAQLLEPELVVTKTGPADALPGDTIVHTIKVRNEGRGPALNVVLDDTRPDGSVVSFDLGTMIVGSEVTLTVATSVPCSTADLTVLVDTATASGEDMLGNSVTGVGTASTAVHAPVMELTKSASATVNAGEAIAYAITYENTGSGNATDVDITDMLAADVYYSILLDLGAGPVPSSVTPNGDGTTTLTWPIGLVPALSGPMGIEYTARPSLLFLGGETLANGARLTFTNANGCTYDALTASASTNITVVPPSGDPRTLGFWRNQPELWTDETLARIQATDQRYDTDGDGALSAAEVTTMLAAGGNQPKVLQIQLLATYFNLATRQVNAATLIESKTADRLGLENVAEAAIYAMDTLLLPVDSASRERYSDATRVLDEINNNRSEVY